MRDRPACSPFTLTTLNLKKQRAIDAVAPLRVTLKMAQLGAIFANPTASVDPPCLLHHLLSRVVAILTLVVAHFPEAINTEVPLCLGDSCLPREFPSTSKELAVGLRYIIILSLP